MKAIEKMTSKEASAELTKLNARRAEINERLTLLKAPPNRAAPPDAGPTGWTPPDPLQGAGAEYARVALEGTPAEMLELEREREQLQAEASQLFFRRARLEARVKVAGEQERRAAAPKRVAELLKRSDAVLDELDRARAALRAAQDATGGHFRELGEQRALAGVDAPGLTPAQVYRLVAQLKGEVKWLHRIPGDHIAENRTLLEAVQRYLEPLPVPLIERLRQRFPVMGDTFLGARNDEATARLEADRIRARLIADREFEAASDFGIVAREVVKARWGGGERSQASRPSDAMIDSWLEPARAKVAAQLTK